MERKSVYKLLRWHQGVNSFTSNEEKNGVAQLEKPQEGVVIVPPRYYVENVKALMDEPGEWYYDHQKKELSFIPTPELNGSEDATISAPQIAELLIVKGERG